MNGRMTSVRFSTTLSNQFQEHEEIHYRYKLPTSQYPEKQILPSGSEFQFLTENRNEDLYGIVTPKHQNHIFSLIPLVGKTMFYYRPPWLNAGSKAYQLIFNEIETRLETEKLIFPNGNYIKLFNNSIVGCKNTTDPSFLNTCYIITSDKTLTDISSTYQIEREGKVMKHVFW